MALPWPKECGSVTKDKYQPDTGRRKSRRPNSSGLKKVNARVDRLILRFNKLKLLIAEQFSTPSMDEEE